MSKNITISGQNYTNKRAIKAKITGSESYATFVDASIVDAVASDVATGKKIVDANGNEIVGTKITPSGTVQLTENGTYDVTSKATAVVNVSGSSSGGTSMANLTVYVADFTDKDTCALTKGYYDTKQRSITT